MSDGEVNLALLQYKSEVGSGVPPGLDRHPPLRLPVRRPAGAAEADREGRRQVLLRSRRARGRRLRAQVQGPERHRLRHQLEGLAAHQGQGEERQGRAPRRLRRNARRRRARKSARRPRSRARWRARRNSARPDRAGFRFQGRNDMNRLVLSLALVALSAAGAQAQNYPTRAVDGDRAVRRGRTGRHHRADRRRHLLAPSRPAVRGRERRRRRRHHRHDPRRARRARRLHADLRPPRHQCAAPAVLSQPRLRRGEGFRADRADRRAAGAA